MNKFVSSTKLISLFAFICVVTVFYYFLNANGNLKAANKIKVNEEKGMTVEEFKKKISQPNKLVMVYFNASWCVPCIKLKPEIAQLEKETKEFCEVLQINTDDNPKVAEYYEINSLPMFVIYKDGKKLWENIGVLTKTQLQSKITAFSK